MWRSTYFNFPTIQHIPIPKDIHEDEFTDHQQKSKISAMLGPISSKYVVTHKDTSSKERLYVSKTTLQ